MTNVVSVLLVKADELPGANARRAGVDGHARVDGVISVQAAQGRGRRWTGRAPATRLSGPACVTGRRGCVTGSPRLPTNPITYGRHAAARPDDRAMTDVSSNAPADRSSGVTGYRSAYVSSYTHVYKQQKEVS